MSIKNRDSSQYKCFSQPNPLVKDQVWHEQDKLVFHNMKWDAIVFPDTSQPEPMQSDLKMKEVAITNDVEISSQVEEVEQMPQLIEPIVVVPQTDRNLKNVVLMHCQPAIMRQSKDDLYGDTYATVQYGEKFTFEGVAVETTDLEFRFWTNVELSKNSVVFPKKYRDNSPFGEFRWWKVKDLVPKSGGYLVDAVISNYQPDFSD